MNKTNHQAGHEAERQVATWLEAQRFKVLELNWRTRRCEIDIIATKRKTLYFIEVKSRRSGTWGSGLDYVTPRKHAQMHYAAETWLSEHEWDHDVRLAVVSVDIERLSFIELVD
ncbi:YraN family protein [Candidatus Saccharibacteria bacterium]|nr:YraN family protein [Candidatus Saccharibacteria bacterium]